VEEHSFLLFHCPKINKNRPKFSLGPILFSSTICFLFVFYGALKFKKKQIVEFFYSIPLGLLFGFFCVTIGSYCVIVWLFSSSCLSFITLLFNIWVIIQLFLSYCSKPICWISYCCLAPLALLFDFFWIAIWFLLGRCSYPLVVTQISYCCSTPPTLLFDPMLFNSSPNLKYLFDLVPLCDYFVTEKKRVRRHPAHWLPSTNPGIHVFLIYSTHIRRPKTPSKLSSYWRLQTLQNRKHTDALLSHDNSTDSTAYISCLSNSYRCQQGRLSYCIHRLCTISESTNSAFHRMFTKKTQNRNAVYSLIPL
jgi:hypothetical protein